MTKQKHLPSRTFASETDNEPSISLPPRHSGAICYLAKVQLSKPTCSKMASETGNRYIHLSAGKSRRYPYRTFENQGLKNRISGCSQSLSFITKKKKKHLSVRAPVRFNPSVVWLRKGASYRDNEISTRTLLLHVPPTPARGWWGRCEGFSWWSSLVWNTLTTGVARQCDLLNANRVKWNSEGAWTNLYFHVIPSPVPY